MNKRLIKQIILAVALMALIIFTYSFFENQKPSIEYLYYYIFVGEKYHIPNPNIPSDYPENRIGYYQFDPKTILAALDQGKTNVFTALSEDDLNDADDEYIDIAWTQSDFLRVANALSQKVWNEPLDLERWDIYFILASGNCSENFSGFNHFYFTYYKTIETGWDNIYIARHISLRPSVGTARWAGNGEFSTPVIFSWKNTELTKFKITAEQAVQIADENGGKADWLKSENKNRCSVSVSLDKNVRNTGSDWLVNYSSTQFFAFINPFTGKVYPK
jgi:hypothetical protein